MGVERPVPRWSCGAAEQRHKLCTDRGNAPVALPASVGGSVQLGSQGRFLRIYKLAQTLHALQEPMKSKSSREEREAQELASRMMRK